MLPASRLIASRMASRRTFSVLTRMRQVARSFEPHPFGRLPQAEKPQPADIGKLARHVGDAAMFYIPGFALFLGWPLAAEKLLDGKMT